MKISTLVLFLFLYSTSFSQNYTAFPDSNATWVNYVYYFGGEFPSTPSIQDLTDLDNYCVNGEDTIIGTNTYNKINYCTGNYKGAFRDTGGIIYIVPKDSLNELIWYNFNLSVGDTFVNYLSLWVVFDTVYVSEIDSILIAGNYRTIISFENCGDTWVEGYGCTAGLFQHPSINTNISGIYATMHCFSHNDTTYIPDGYSTYFNVGSSCALNYLEIRNDKVQKNFVVFPNPTNGVTTIQIKELSLFNQLQVLNSLGQVINIPVEFANSSLQIDFSNLPTGIYFLTLQIDDEIYSQKIIRE